MAIVISGVNNNDKITAADGTIDLLSSANLTGILTAPAFNASNNITAANINVGNNIQLGNAGIITATTFVGNLTGNVNATSNLLLQIGGSEKFRVGSSGQLGIGGANYGTSGQVLTSGGSGGAATWSTITGTTINNQSDNRMITCTGTSDTLNAEQYLTYTSQSSLNLTDGNGTSNLGGNYLLLKRTTGNTNYINAPLDDAELVISADEDIIFRTVHTADFNSTERLRIGSSGQIGLSGTNYGNSGQVLTSQGGSSAPTWTTVASGGSSNISFNSGNGIDFSASADGTGSSSRSELLDDYESGEWTGSINSGTANINNPWYVKIGKLVIGGASISAISDTSSSNSIIVNGLPFSNSGGNSGRGAVSASKNNKFDRMVDCYVSGTTVRFMVSSLSTGSHDYLRHSSMVQSSGSITFGFNYQTS